MNPEAKESALRAAAPASAPGAPIRTELPAPLPEHEELPAPGPTHSWG